MRNGCHPFRFMERNETMKRIPVVVVHPELMATKLSGSQPLCPPLFGQAVAGGNRTLALDRLPRARLHHVADRSLERRQDQPARPAAGPRTPAWAAAGRCC